LASCRCACCSAAASSPGADLITLTPATVDDIPFILALERKLEAARFIRSWTPQMHRSALGNPDLRYFIIADSPGARDGFAISRNLAGDTGSIELKRIGMATPGGGMGRRAIETILAMVFD
jgi:hypothetical protein